MASITLYTAKVCPFAQRVEIALVEAKAKFKTCEVNLPEKPEWFTPRVNPAGQVPVLAYGGPDVPPEDPSPESVKLAESLVLLEFVSDLFPEANLLPKDPVLRARTRFFIEIVASKFVPACRNFIRNVEGYENILAAAEAIQDILPASGSYAVGDQYTIADIALTPFVARMQISCSNEFGKFPLGQGNKLLELLHSDKYAEFHAYIGRILARPSHLATFDAENAITDFARRYPRA